MATPWRPDNFAIGAEAAGLHAVEQLDETKCFVALEYSRIAKPDATAEDAGECEQGLTALKEYISGSRHTKHII